MKFRLWSIPVALSALAVAASYIPASGNASSAPAVFDPSGCRDITSETCPECPQNRMHHCYINELGGMFASCTEITYSPCPGGTCPTTHTSTGPGCPVPP